MILNPAGHGATARVAEHGALGGWMNARDAVCDRRHAIDRRPPVLAATPTRGEPRRIPLAVAARLAHLRQTRRADRPPGARPLPYRTDWRHQ